MFFRRPNRIRRTGDDRPVRGLYAFVWRMSGRRQMLAVGLALVVAALSVAPLELQRRIIDDAIASKDTSLLTLLAGLYLGALLLTALLKLGMRLYQGWLAESAILYCRRHLAQLHDAAHPDGAPDHGAAVSIIRSEIEQLGGFVGEAFSEPAAHLGVLVAALGYMLYVEPVIASISLCFLLPQVVLSPLLQRKINTLIELRIGHLRTLSDYVASAEPGALDKGAFEMRSGKVYGNQMRLFLWKFASKALLNLLNLLAPLAALSVGGWMVIEGAVELGVVVAFTSGFTKLGEPLRELITFYRFAARTAVQHEAIARWMPKKKRGWTARTAAPLAAAGG